MRLALARKTLADDLPELPLRRMVDVAALTRRGCVLRAIPLACEPSRSATREKAVRRRPVDEVATRMRCAGVLLIVLVSVAACRDAPAGITVGNGDTVVINARRAVTLPVRDVIDDRQVQYEVTSGTVLRALGGDSLACSGRGDARLRMTAGSVSSSVVVLCRPIKAVSNVRVVELIAGGPPQPLAIGGVDDSGRTVGRIAVDVTVRDSSIAVVREGLIYPRRPGWTFLLFDLAGCQVQSLVRVHDPAPAADTLPRPARFPKIDRRKMCAEVPPWGYPW